MFSLFGRRDKPDPRRVRDAVPARTADSTLRGPTTTNVESHREIARRTAEKIDQIESEMISAPPTAPASRTMPEAPTRPMPQGKPPTPAVPPSHAAQPFALAAAEPRAPLPPLEFSTSVVLGDTRAVAGGIEVNASSLPHELEEAAILFANGQAQPAAATLKAAIARGHLEGGGQQAWLMLFDVLQCTGAKAEFESVALDYAARFEKSPPAWQEGAAEAPAAVRRPAAAAVVPFPARLDATVARQIELVQRAGSNKRAITLDFGATVAADSRGALMVVKTIEDFEKAGHDLVVLGAQRLFDAARAAIEPGRRDEADGCWQLALLGLRLLGERQPFDDLSIDFCVTYEVSPPSWEQLPACIRTAAPAQASAEPAGTAAVEGNAFLLRGELVGRCTGELNALRAYAAERADVVVDCRTLRRVDFVAAGELLNEVVALSGAGKTVLFVEPGFMVEALLIVMGIHELAEIRRRRI